MYKQDTNFQSNRTRVNLNESLILDSGMESTEDFLNEARSFAFNSKISANQLRDLYDLILELRNPSEPKRKIAKILIKLEYAFRRKNVQEEFYYGIKPVLETLLKNSNDLQKIKNFIDFMEAVVAYSKKS